MSEFEKAVQRRRLAHAVGCYFAAGDDFFERSHWRDQVLNVLDREGDRVG